MFRNRIETVIKCPADQVFAYLADVRRQPEWTHMMEQVRFDEPGQQVGARAVQTMKIFGRRRDFALTTTVYEPGRRIHFSKTEPFPIRFGFELVPEGERTRVAYVVEMEPRGLFRLMIGLIGKRENTKDLETIRRLLESEPRRQAA